MAKDSYGYGGYMKESTVKRFLHEEMNKSIQGLVGIRATPHIITGPPQPIPVTLFAPSRQFISYQQYPQVPKQPRQPVIPVLDMMSHCNLERELKKVGLPVPKDRSEQIRRLKEFNSTIVSYNR
jgi:hypothetical protein